MRDCFGHDRHIYVVAVDGALLAFLAGFGDLSLFGDPPRRFLRMDVTGKFRLSAVTGAEKITVNFRNPAAQQEFEERLTVHLGQAS